MVKASQNVLVTGNGFDLYHGLKTNYMDFVKCVEDAFGKRKEERNVFETKLTEFCNVNGFFRHFHFTMLDQPTWTNFEKEMEIILQALIHFLDVVKEQQKDVEFDLVSFNVYGGIFSYNDLQIFKHFSRVFEQIYDDPSGGMFKIRQQYITLEKVLNKKAVIDEVRRELESFTKALDLYLSTCAEPAACQVKASRIAAIDPDYVINFNFTDTVRMYGVPEENIFYAKGKAGSEPLNLVLGVPDESEEHMDWIWLKNYFQKLMKFIGLPDKEQLYPENEEGEPVPVVSHYFGYSFPLGDAELIKDIARASSGMVIYYINMEDYACKVIQLLKIFGKDEIMEKIQSKKIVFEAV